MKYVNSRSYIDIIHEKYPEMDKKIIEKILKKACYLITWMLQRKHSVLVEFLDGRQTETREIRYYFLGENYTERPLTDLNEKARYYRDLKKNIQTLRYFYGNPTNNKFISGRS